MIRHKSQPLVAVTQRVDIFPERSEIRDSLDQNLSNLLLTLGIMPIPISNTLVFNGKSLEKFLKKFKPTGILLSGGGRQGDYENRDKTELALVEYAKENNLPLLGICRGMQVLAQMHGVEIDLVSSHVDSRHRLITKESRISIPEEVNSFHEYGLKTCPEHFEILAQTEDGSIEAIKHKTYPWLGLMWHPERERPYSKSDLNIIKKLYFDNKIY